jgi:hypothetical protein
VTSSRADLHHTDKASSWTHSYPDLIRQDAAAQTAFRIQFKPQMANHEAGEFQDAGFAGHGFLGPVGQHFSNRRPLDADGVQVSAKADAFGGRAWAWVGQGGSPFLRE